MSKITRKQMNESVPKIFRVTFNNGNGTRSTAPIGVGNIAAIPGATGDTSYTAPSNQDVDILFTMTQMANPATNSTLRIYLSINGANYGPGLYMDAIGGWPNLTCSYKYQLNAGQTITIGPLS